LIIKVSSYKRRRENIRQVGRCLKNQIRIKPDSKFKVHYQEIIQTTRYGYFEYVEHVVICSEM